MCGDVYAKEMVERAHICHRELTVERGDDGLEEGGCAGDEDNIIYVEKQVSRGSTAMKQK